MNSLSTKILLIAVIALPVLPFAYICFLPWRNPHQLYRLVGTWLYHTTTPRTVELKSPPEKELSKYQLWAIRMVLSINAAVYLAIVFYLLTVII